MIRRTLPPLLALTLAAGCSGLAADRAIVTGTGPELLKLRTGPGLDYGVVRGLPDGTELNRYHCVTEIGQLWCEVSPVDAAGVRGWVSADYLSGS